MLLGIALAGVSLFLRPWLAQGPNGVRHGFSVGWGGGKPTMIHEIKRGELRGYQWVFPFDDNPGTWRIDTGLGASDPFGVGEPDEPMRGILLRAISRQALVLGSSVPSISKTNSLPVMKSVSRVFIRTR